MAPPSAPALAADPPSAIDGLSLWAHRTAAVLRGMATQLLRSALSLEITASAEYAAALCDIAGRTVLECGDSPLLRGSLGAQVVAAVSHAALAQLGPEETLVANDPHSGGSDLSTLTMMTPLYGQMREHRPR